MSEKQETVTIDVPEDSTPEPMTEEALREQGVGDHQIEMAKEHGLIDEPKEEQEDGADEGEPKPDPEEDSGSEQEEQEEQAEEGDGSEEKPAGEEALKDFRNFQDVHNLFENEPKKFRELPEAVRNMYHEQKGFYKLAKTETTARKEKEKELEFSQVQTKGARSVLDKLSERLARAVANPNDLPTVEELQALLGEAEPKQEFVTKEELAKQKEEADTKAANAEYYRDKLLEAEKLGNTEVENFDTVIEQAKEVANKSVTYQRTLSDALINREVDERGLLTTILDIAKLHKDFGKKPDNNKPVEKPSGDSKVDRVVKNAGKKASSAAVGSGGGKRVVSHDDLTPEDAIHMTQKEWNNLPASVRKRLLMG